MFQLMSYNINIIHCSQIEPIMKNSQPSNNKEAGACVTVLKPRSIVWKLFKIDEKDQTKAVCEVCNDKISRGVKVGSFTTSNMLKHLNSKHNNELREQEQKEKLEPPKKRILPTNISLKKK